MMLGELIKALEAMPQDAVVPVGFGSPGSWRGSYSELAFEPKENVRVSDMLADARAALGKTFTGYKGGDFEMHSHVDVHLDYYGECYDHTMRILLGYMVGKPECPKEAL